MRWYVRRVIKPDLSLVMEFPEYEINIRLISLF